VLFLLLSPLVACFVIYGRKRKVLSFVLSRTPHETKMLQPNINTSVFQISGIVIPTGIKTERNRRFSKAQADLTDSCHVAYISGSKLSFGLSLKPTCLCASWYVHVSKVWSIMIYSGRIRILPRLFSEYTITFLFIVLNSSSLFGVRETPHLFLLFFVFL
jgi:hypothetical protein